MVSDTVNIFKIAFWVLRISMWPQTNGKKIYFFVSVINVIYSYIINLNVNMIEVIIF